MKVSFKVKGDFNHLEKFFNTVKGKRYLNVLDHYGRLGVEALSANTPVRTGLTASSWYYYIEEGKDLTSLVWANSNVNKNVNIAIILQYGHGTRNGGYVQGVDYINPALKPIFEDLANNLWKEVTGS